MGPSRSKKQPRVIQRLIRILSRAPHRREISHTSTSPPPKSHRGSSWSCKVKNPGQDLASSISSSSLCRGMRCWRCSCRRVCTARTAVCRSSGSVMSSRPARRCSLQDDSYSCRASCSSSWKRSTESGQSSGSASVETHGEMSLNEAFILKNKMN